MQFRAAPLKTERGQCLRYLDGKRFCEVGKTASGKLGLIDKNSMRGIGSSSHTKQSGDPRLRIPRERLGPPASSWSPYHLVSLQPRWSGASFPLCVSHKYQTMRRSASKRCGIMHLTNPRKQPKLAV